MDTFLFQHCLFLCTTLTRIAQNDFLPDNVYAYFLCGVMCTWIHESDAELICMCFFFSSDVLDSNILCYVSGFYMLLFSRQMFLMCSHARARVCV